PPDVVFPRAKAAALQALALDPDLAEAHTSLAFVHVEGEWDWSRGEEEYRRALEMDRAYPTAHQWYGILLVILGRSDEGIAHAVEAVRLDPLSFILYSTAGDTFYYSRRFDEALAINQRGVELAPTAGQARVDLARSLELAGRYDEAIAEYRRGGELMNSDLSRSPGLACAHAAAGHVDEARKILAAMEAHAEKAYVPQYAFASVHTRLGEYDAALEALERAFAGRDRAMVYLNVNPRFDPLHGDPRFQDLVRRMRLAP